MGMQRVEARPSPHTDQRSGGRAIALPRRRSTANVARRGGRRWIVLARRLATTTSAPCEQWRSGAVEEDTCSTQAARYFPRMRPMAVHRRFAGSVTLRAGTDRLGRSVLRCETHSYLVSRVVRVIRYVLPISGTHDSISLGSCATALQNLVAADKSASQCIGRATSTPSHSDASAPS